MRYAIYLDETEIEKFYTDELSAIKKYEEEKKSYIGEDIYDKIQLVKFEVIRESDLIVK